MTAKSKSGKSSVNERRKEFWHAVSISVIGGLILIACKTFLQVDEHPAIRPMDREAQIEIEQRGKSVQANGVPSIQLSAVRDEPSIFGTWVEDEPARRSSDVRFVFNSPSQNAPFELEITPSHPNFVGVFRCAKTIHFVLKGKVERRAAGELLDPTTGLVKGDFRIDQGAGAISLRLWPDVSNEIVMTLVRPLPPGVIGDSGSRTFEVSRHQ